MNSQEPDLRIKKRLPCDLSFAGHRYPGIVLNLSRSGLFVQTSMRAQPGELVDVELGNASERQPIALQARVVWKRVVSQQLRSVQQAGLGLEIYDPSRSYDGLVVDIQSTRHDRGRAPTTQTAHPTPKTVAHSGEEYRVRLGLPGSQRSRTLTVRAESERDAREMAARRCGQGWTILELEKR